MKNDRKVDNTDEKSSPEQVDLHSGGDENQSANSERAASDGGERNVERKEVSNKPGTSSAQRRSTRTRRATATYRGSPYPTSPEAAKTPRKSVTSKKPKKSVKDETSEGSVIENNEDEESSLNTSSVRRPGRSRKSVKNEQTPSSSATVTPSSSKKGKNANPTIKTEAHKGAVDPFDFDDSINSHPEPLDNVVVARQAFGDVKFAVAPSSSTGTPKYQKTEQNAKDMLAIKKLETPLRSNVTRTPTSRRRGGGIAKSARSHSASTSIPLKLKNNNNADELEFMDFKDSDTEVVQATPKRKRDDSSDMTPISIKRMKAVNAEPPTLTAEEQIEVDFPEDLMSVPVGGRVYGLWGKVYYPGIVVSYDGTRYRVYFVEDKKYKNLTDNGIIPVRDLTPSMQVDVANGEQNFTVEIKSAPNREIAEHWVDGFFEGFTDEAKKNVMSFSWDKVSFDTDQAKEIQEQEESFAKFSSGKVVVPSSQSRSRRSAISYEVPKASSPASVTPSRKAPKAAPTPRHRDTGKTTESKKLFLGKQFVLTSATRAPGEAQYFNKKEMKRTIVNEGGVVLEDLMAADPEMEIFLVADMHYRTFKYLSALSLSIPCVSYSWLNDCFEQNELLDREPYMLTAGVNIITNDNVRWHPNTDLLKGKNIFLCGDSNPDPVSVPKHFVQMWTPMLETMGANVLTELPSKNEDIDVMITDGIRCEDTIAEARRRKVPVMSSEWIISTIIIGEFLKFDAHEKFPFTDDLKQNRQDERPSDA
ncbi:hypothetical protein QR680_009563 [Steinernema hermaphroditum]|uniref:BRCT domain-containing protein n=1 Tax=Steinernema hermaphroditum TaxID=289476 RepID=A0AA39IMU1_9BILA|nr:hypothetical protein QR680_009563 [Steinernema hermaphroditum]